MPSHRVAAVSHRLTEPHPAVWLRRKCALPDLTATISQDARGQRLTALRVAFPLTPRSVRRLELARSDLPLNWRLAASRSAGRTIAAYGPAGPYERCGAALIGALETGRGACIEATTQCVVVSRVRDPHTRAHGAP